MWKLCFKIEVDEARREGWLMVSGAQDNDKIVQKAITMHANREQCLEQKKFLIEIILLL